jgi:hypothetical protein
MGIWNTNFFHNIMNGGALILGGMGVLALATGCTDMDPGPAVALECSKSFVPPQYSAYFLVAFGGVKWLINATRDGIPGMWKQQPPVVTVLPVVPVKTTPDDATVKVEYKTAGSKETKKDTHVY